MKRVCVAIAAVVSLVASNAFAATRYDISNMACSTVQALIEDEGAAVLSYPSSSILGLPVYDRFVKNRNYCKNTEVTRRTGLPTTDKKYCPVYKCVESKIFEAR